MSINVALLGPKNDGTESTIVLVCMCAPSHCTFACKSCQAHEFIGLAREHTHTDELRDVLVAHTRDPVGFESRIGVASR